MVACLISGSHNAVYVYETKSADSKPFASRAFGQDYKEDKPATPKMNASGLSASKFKEDP